MRHVRLAALVLLGACAHGGGSLFRGNAPSAAWESTLQRARELSVARRYDQADKALVDFRARYPLSAEAAEALYWRAVLKLDAGNERPTLDSALAHLDAYMIYTPQPQHFMEASALRKLARSTMQLSRVEAALQQAKAGSDNRPRTETETKVRDEELVKEVQRLKDELAKANEELERIRKRLATPKPPSAP